MIQLQDKHIAVSFNIFLPDSFSRKIKNIQDELYEVIPDRRKYDTSPHLSICTKFMKVGNIEDFVKTVKKEFSNCKSFKLKFTTVGPTKGLNYIFLYLDEDSKAFLRNMNTHALNATKGMGLETIDGTPIKYPYLPHISIIKLYPEHVEEALRIIGNNFLPIDINISTLEITQELESDEGIIFPRICRLDLK